MKVSRLKYEESAFEVKKKQISSCGPSKVTTISDPCHSEEVARRPTTVRQAHGPERSRRGNPRLTVKNRGSRFLSRDCGIGMTGRGDFHRYGWADGPSDTQHDRYRFSPARVSTVPCLSLWN